MIINVNLTGRVPIPYIPSYIRNGKDFNTKSEAKEVKEAKEAEDSQAYIILENIDYGFMERLKARQIQILQDIKKGGGEHDSAGVAAATEAQMKYVRQVWREHVAGFTGLFDQTGKLVTKEMVESDAILLDDMLLNISLELGNLASTLRAERCLKKSSLQSSTSQSVSTTVTS
ncbi:hypothetical protein [Borrelia sp. P9F1]|uniref:hypothetical protein n=1 Tax=Borrelia sp. P9F1 TaxID=3058374 RepID=UPI0026486F5A|nr:hypothetical protein [Borrelia sp. P9F1]WKC58494.1 hypothetical protein QYZ68_04765 [Borrelia sp. P9F1]